MESQVPGLWGIGRACTVESVRTGRSNSFYIDKQPVVYENIKEWPYWKKAANKC